MKNIYSILSIIAPTLLLIELAYCWLSRKNYYSFQDSVSSMGTAIVNQCMNLLVLWVVVLTYGWLHDNYSLTTLPMNLANWVLLIIIIDFLFYWFHRMGHNINIFWAAHSPHHSSEEFNLMVGLRASVTQRIASFTMFWPLTLIGFSPEMIYAATGIHLILGYWHHTRVIPKLGWFEEVFNSPSHHRVHHGTNQKYLDKNFAELIIIWDRIFGTFEREDENEPVCYGILRHPQTWSPLGINFHFYGLLWQDMKETPKWWDKFRLWFMPLGWRPPGVSPRDGVKAYSLDEQRKFTTPMLKGSRTYLIISIMMAFLLMFCTITLRFDVTTLERAVMATLVVMCSVQWSHVISNKINNPFVAIFLILKPIVCSIIFLKINPIIGGVLFAGYAMDLLFYLKLIIRRDQTLDTQPAS